MGPFVQCHLSGSRPAVSDFSLIAALTGSLVEDALREEIARLMSLQAIDRELRELEQAFSSVAARVEQLRLDVQK
ncbi:MAG: hypothetical protein JO071_07455, partial [Deltaproteobacteria bacterium]|nr:hypothetical protein [Deltaproteobacteria bacterium]